MYNNIQNYFNSNNSTTGEITDIGNPNISTDKDLDLNNKKIINLAAPAADADATNKKYIHDNFFTPFNTTDIDFNSCRLKNVSIPLEQGGVTTKGYVENNFLSKTIGSDLDMNSNKITNLSDPNANTDAANKNYVDNRVTYFLNLGRINL